MAEPNCFFMKIKLPRQIDHPLTRAMVNFLLVWMMRTEVSASEMAGTGPAAVASLPVDLASATRYGCCNLLDRRSTYAGGVFPEPFLVDDTVLETDEFRLDWLRTWAHGQRGDFAKAELEKGFGLLTLELELPFEQARTDGHTVRGLGNINVGARHPIYQFVSDDGFINSTVGAAVEVGFPTGSQVSSNTEFVPKIFNDLSLGRHFTIQSLLGVSTLYGGGADGGSQSIEYGLVFGYAISQRDLPLPGIRQLVPVLELQGVGALNKAAAGSNSLLGNLAIRANLSPLGDVQPRIGLGYVFPIGQEAHQGVSAGLIVSLVFEY
jgi:hypothetical protein